MCKKSLIVVDNYPIFILSQALDGFVIVLTQELELFYASETIQDYLGLSQVGFSNENLYKYSLK